MTSPILDESTLQDFSGSVRGDVLQQGDDGYDEARTVWNALYDKTPALIVSCSGVADVIAAVDFAREQDLPVSLKSGGHSYAGTSVSDDSLMIDLSSMNSVRIDPDEKKARVGPGTTWGAFDHEAQALGLATTGVTVSTVGVAGSTLGGGSGWLARKYGLSLDNLLSADVVTAQGELVHVSESENQDLFWALRGGTSNFGVVTSLEFALYEFGPEILAGQVIHPFEEAGSVLEFYDSFMTDAPDEVTCYPFILHLPPIPAISEDYHGETAISLVVGYVGDVEAGEEALQSVRDFGDPLLDSVRTLPYTMLQQAFDEGMQKGNRWYSQAHYLDGLPDGAIDTILNYTDPLPGQFTVVYLERMGGAINTVDPEETAFPHRNAKYGIHIFPGWTDPEKDETHISWAREFHEAMKPYANGGVYVNLLSRDETARVKNAYGDNYDRLAQVKNKWDPHNLFRVNHNITPGG